MPEFKLDTRLMKRWEKNPMEMFAWRTDEFKKLLLLLQHKAHHPEGSARSKDALQLKAIDMFQKLLVAMEDVRSEVPVACPKCGEQFTID